MNTVLVTGATSGIGWAIAQELARAEDHVLALGRNPVALSRIGALAGVTPIAVDLSDAEAVARALHGHDPEILVNNAGVVPSHGPFAGPIAAESDRAIAVNLTAQIGLTRAVLPGMLARGRGMSSSPGRSRRSRLRPTWRSIPRQRLAFASALREEVRGKGVRVTEIVAGRVQTDLYRSVLTEAQRAALYERVTAVQPEDAAHVVRVVLDLPDSAEFSRFEIIPTHSGPETGIVPYKGVQTSRTKPARSKPMKTMFKTAAFCTALALSAGAAQAESGETLKTAE